METSLRTQGYFSEGPLLSASILALWLLHSSQAALHIQKIPEQPHKNQDLLLSVQGVPSTFQDFIWYLGEETNGGTRLFTYIPGLQRPQRDGNAIGQRDIVGFPNGSMLLRRAQPSDSGTYQVAVTVNSAWTMRAKTEVQVAEKSEPLSTPALPMSAWTVAAIVFASIAAGSLVVSSIMYLLLTRGRCGQSPRVTATEKPERSPSRDAGDNVYEVMPSPVLLLSPLSDMRPRNPAEPPSLPPPQKPEPETHHYQDLLNPDPAPYCQLVPTS